MNVGRCEPPPVVEMINQTCSFNLREVYLRLERPQTCGVPSMARFLVIQPSQCVVADFGSRHGQQTVRVHLMNTSLSQLTHRPLSKECA